MDKARDVRRGASRVNHFGQKLTSGVDGEGGFLFSEKSRKEKQKKWSAVVGRSSSRHEDCGMGFDISDMENELRSASTSKRFKLSKEISDDCNGVGHVYVPRRLRSAIMNCGHDHVSLSLTDSKKLNHTISGTQLQELSAVRKTKSTMKQRTLDKCPKRTVFGPITKDEEEVVETLYALAGMFFNNSNDKCEKDVESVEPKPSDFAETTAVEEKNVRSALPLMTDQSAVPSSRPDKLNVMVKVDSLNEQSSQENPTSHDDFVRQVNPCTLSSLAKCDMKPLSSSVKWSSVKLHLDTGLKQLQQKDALILDKTEIGRGKGTTIGSQLGSRYAVGESKKTSVAIWPGLPPIVSQGAGVDDTCFRPLAAKIPVWLEVPSPASRASSIQNYSSKKVSKVTTDRRLSKRCATQVYISRLIQALKQGDSFTINNMYGEKNDLDALVSANSIINAIADKNSNGANCGVQLSALASVQFALQQQNIDFLSLSAGGSVLEIHDGSDRTRNRLELLSSLQVPYLHSLMQHQFCPPFSLPESSACPDHLSSVLQAYPYGSLFYGAQASSIVLTKQQQQLSGAHYRPNDTSKMTSEDANLQNGATTQHLLQQHPQLISITTSPFSSCSDETRPPHTFCI